MYKLKAVALTVVSAIRNGFTSLSITLNPDAFTDKRTGEVDITTPLAKAIGGLIDIIRWGGVALVIWGGVTIAFAQTTGNGEKRNTGLKMVAGGIGAYLIKSILRWMGLIA